MSDDARDAPLARWADALRVAALLAVDPHGLGGVVVRAQHGPVRDRWLDTLRSLLPPGSPLRRVPQHVDDDRLLGGLDLAATLRTGRPVAQPGLLAESDGGMLLLAMAERVGAAAAARLCAALDRGEIAVARDGLEMLHPARIGMVALDEGIGDDPAPPAALLERLAFRLELAEVAIGDAEALDGKEHAGATAALGAGARRAPGGAARRHPAAGSGPGAAGSPGMSTQPVPGDPILAARARLPAVTVDDGTRDALCAAALALGAGSMRASLFALRAARAAAALDGRDRVSTEDAELAARLVLGPRATRMPAPPDAEPPAEPPESDTPESETPPDDPDPAADEPLPDRPLDDVVLDAARAAIPAGLLAQLALLQSGALPGGGGGRAGAQRQARLRGRPIGARPGLPRGGARLALIDTLRAAAPWQPMRRAQALAQASASPGTAPAPASCPPIALRAGDFRVRRLRERAETTTIFAIDASGSAALHRLAEAKGAVELLLADCYVRRDRVAVIAFRARAAEVLLAPTRSLVRAKRSLAGLPGGGGTPLAAGLDAAAALADAARRRGGTPVIVMLTDGRANVARDGSGGRARADLDARDAARRLRAAGFTALLIDTSPQPQPTARALAAEMGAAYLPLPHADAAAMSHTVRAVTASSTRGPAGAR